jgi:hypothetical protein
MRDGRRRHHVCCARADRTRAGHHAAPLTRLGDTADCQYGVCQWEDSLASRSR